MSRTTPTRTKTSRPTPEKIILDGVPVPRIAHLEVSGAQLASFRVLERVPAYLGGDGGLVGDELMVFRRTSEIRGGFAVFRPA